MHPRWKLTPVTFLATLTLVMCAACGCHKGTTANAPTTHVPAQNGQAQAEHKPPNPQLETPAKASGSEVEIHYSPQENLEQIDSALLSSAKSEIEFTAYSFTDSKLAEVLEEKAREGVTIEIYTDRGSVMEELSRGKGAEPVILELARTPNIQVRVKHSSVLAHIKAFEVDERILRTGSANFSANAEKMQDNDLLVTRDSTIIAAFHAKFQEMWDRPDNEPLR